MKKISKKFTTSRTTSRTRSKKTKKQFLYNPKNPSKSLDLFTDENPNDTIHIKYTTLDDVKTTITKLEKLYINKKYPHKRITQVAMIMKIRLEYLKNNKPEQYNLANKYYKFLGIRTKKNDIARYKLIFRY